MTGRFIAFLCGAMLVVQIPAHAKPEQPKRQAAALLLPIAPGEFGQIAGKPFVVKDKFSVPAIAESDADTLSGVNALCDMSFDGKPAPGGGEAGVLVALFGALLKPLFGMVFHKADQAIDAKIEAYKAEWSTGMTASLFVTDASGTVMPRYRCLRVVRVSEDGDAPADEAKIDFDAMFLVHWLPKSQSWQLLPLRVFTDDPAAQGTAVKYAMSLAGSAAGVKDGRGIVDSLTESVILKGGYSIDAAAKVTSGKPKTSYPIPVCDLLESKLATSAVFRSDASFAKCNSERMGKATDALVSNYTALAIPGQLPVGKSGEGSAVNVVLKVAEVGQGKKLDQLKAWKTFLSKAGDGISGALTTAITDLIDGGE